MLNLNPNIGVTLYDPPFGAPSAGSHVAGFIRDFREDMGFISLEQLGLAECIHQIAFRIFRILPMFGASVLDFCDWIWPLRTFDSLGNEVHNLISILVSPFFALTTPFGYVPRPDLSRANLDSLIGMSDAIQLTENELTQLTQTPRFREKLEQSSWLRSDKICSELYALAVRNNNRALFRQVVEGGTRDFPACTINSLPLSCFKIWLEVNKSSEEETRDIAYKLLRKGTQGTHDAKPYFDAMLHSGITPTFDLETYLSTRSSEREQMESASVAGMLIRGGVRLKCNLDELNVAYEWLQRVRAALDLPSADARNIAAIRTQLRMLENEITPGNTLMTSIWERSVAPALYIQAEFRERIDESLKSWRICKDRIFPRLLRMQKQIQEIEEFECQRLPYCSAEELQAKSRQVRTQKSSVLRTMLQDNYLLSDDPVKIIESYYLMDIDNR